MRQIPIVLSLCFAFAACADRSGNLLGTGPEDQAPVQGPNDTDPLSKGPERHDPPQVVDQGPEQPDNGGGPYPGDGTDGGIMGSTPVPEPGTLLLVGTGLAGIAMLRRRRVQPQA